MEDDLAIRHLLVDILDLLGYEVETSVNGEEALQLYDEAITAEKPFAVVIMDLTIPGGMGGREAVQKLKERHPRAKAIVSSGYANDQALADYQEIGFNGLIGKPYRVKDLAAILDEVIQG
jgi:two-component system cell cycle sensor histidine kinase/response regulator CckA